MNSWLHHLMDQGTLAPGDRVRYIDHTGGGAEYKATLDRHGNIICYSHPHPHPRQGVGATDPWGAAVLVFSSASLFVRHCAGLDSRPSSRHYGSLYVNGVAWPNLLQVARNMEPQRPYGEASDAHRRHMQPCDANDVLGGAEREEKGKAQYEATLPFLQGPRCLRVLLMRLTCSLPSRRSLLPPWPVSPPPSRARQAVVQGPPLPPPLSITATSPHLRVRGRGGERRQGVLCPRWGCRKQQFKFLGGQRFPVGVLMSTEHNEQPLLCTATPERRPVAMIKRSTPMANCCTFSMRCAIWSAGAPRRWLTTSLPSSST